MMCEWYNANVAKLAIEKYIIYLPLSVAPSVAAAARGGTDTRRPDPNDAATLYTAVCVCVGANPVRNLCVRQGADMLDGQRRCSKVGRCVGNCSMIDGRLGWGLRIWLWAIQYNPGD